MQYDSDTQPYIEDAPQRFSEQNKMITLAIVNLLLAIMWEMFVPAFGAADYGIGFVIGALALTVYEHHYGQRIFWLISFIFYELWQILISNLRLAWLVLQPKPSLDPGIIRVPLTVSSDLEIILLALVIDLAPGTITLDLQRDDSGQNTLYVHSLLVNDPEAFRRDIKETLERRLLVAARGETS
jgi:multicomponent Na+:H+ antiporter subunit E